MQLHDSLRSTERCKNLWKDSLLRTVLQRYAHWILFKVVSDVVLFLHVLDNDRRATIETLPIVDGVDTVLLCLDRELYCAVNETRGEAHCLSALLLPYVSTASCCTLPERASRHTLDERVHAEGSYSLEYFRFIVLRSRKYSSEQELFRYTGFPLLSMQNDRLLAGLFNRLHWLPDS